MIVGEPIAALRRVYFDVRDLDGELTTSAATGAPAGTIRTSSNGTAFANALGTFAHVGGGLYYYEATVAEAAIPGFLWIKFERALFQRRDANTTIGDVFKLGQTTAALLRLPLLITDTDDEPAEGAEAADVYSSLNGAAFATATGGLIELTDGVYYYQGTAPDAAVAGLFVINTDLGGFKTAIAYTSVAQAAGGSGGPVITSTSPVEGQALGSSTKLVLVVESADGDVDTIDLIEVRTLDSSSYVTIYNGTVFASPYEDSEIDITGGIATITLSRDDGWRKGVAVVRVTATDENDNQNTDRAGSWLGSGSIFEPIEVEVSFDIEEPTDHVSEALDRLCQQFRGDLDE